MKKQLVLLLVVILNFNCYSQISFEEGYYIDINNKRTNCLIKNIDWNNNPTGFEYKLSENDKSKKAVIKLIKEFGIYNISKYVKSTVIIDRSNDNINSLSDDENPIFKEEDLFLKVLIEGKANLYLFQDKSIRRYFYNKRNTPIEQLIYKLYNTSKINEIGINTKFRTQLLDNLKCSNFTVNRVKDLDYQKNDLINFSQYMTKIIKYLLNVRSSSVKTSYY